MSSLKEHIEQLKMLKEKYDVYHHAFVTISQVTMATHLEEIEKLLEQSEQDKEQGS